MPHRQEVTYKVESFKEKHVLDEFISHIGQNGNFDIDSYDFFSHRSELY